MSVGKKRITLKVADFIGLFNFEWHGQNKVGNVVILVLWRDREKLYGIDYRRSLHPVQRIIVRFQVIGFILFRSSCSLVCHHI